jgi:hypothetical protein
LWPAGQWYVGVAWTRKITDEQSTSAARLPSCAKNKHTHTERERERERWQAYVLLITRCQPLTESAAPGPDPPARSARASPFSKAAGACRGVGAAGWRDGRANRLPLAVAVRRARALLPSGLVRARTEWAGMDSARCAGAGQYGGRDGAPLGSAGLLLCLVLGWVPPATLPLPGWTREASKHGISLISPDATTCAEHAMASNQPNLSIPSTAGDRGPSFTRAAYAMALKSFLLFFFLTIESRSSSYYIRTVLR